MMLLFMFLLSLFMLCFRCYQHRSVDNVVLAFCLCLNSLVLLSVSSGVVVALMFVVVVIVVSYVVVILLEKTINLKLHMV